jgi:hypothetical protein
MIEPLSVASASRRSTTHSTLTCERIFTDEVFGVRDERPGLARRLDFLRARGHRVVPDRLGRSMSAAMTTPSPPAVYLLATLHRRAIRPLGVGASVGAYCSRRPGIDRYWAPATAPDCVLAAEAACARS